MLAVFVYVCVVECFQQKMHVMTCHIVSVSLFDGFHSLLQLCLHFPLAFECSDLCGVLICDGLQRSYKLLYFTLLLFQYLFHCIETTVLMHQLIEFHSDVVPQLDGETVVFVQTQTLLLWTLDAYECCLFAVERMAKLRSRCSAE
jgi:hypothetical protein